MKASTHFILLFSSYVGFFQRTVCPMSHKSTKIFIINVNKSEEKKVDCYVQNNHNLYKCLFIIFLKQKFSLIDE